MKKLLLGLVIVAALAVSTVQANAAAPVVVPACETVAATGAGAGIVTFTSAVGLAAGATYLIATNQDPIWHRLACGLFGDEGRVGNEKVSACQYHD